MGVSDADRAVKFVDSLVVLAVSPPFSTGSRSPSALGLRTAGGASVVPPSPSYPGKVRVLDLTDPDIAKQWGYAGGPITPETRALGERAREAGYNAVRFLSERSAGANLAVLDDFNEVLEPQMVAPVPGNP